MYSDKNMVEVTVVDNSNRCYFQYEQSKIYFLLPLHFLTNFEF